MPALNSIQKAEELLARMEGMREFLRWEIEQGVVDHFKTVGNNELRVWLKADTGQAADIVMRVTDVSVWVHSGPCHVVVMKGAWRLPKYGFRKPVPQARPIMKSMLDELAWIA